MYKRNQRGESMFPVVIGAAVILFGLIFAGFYIFSVTHVENKTCTIDSKESVAKGGEEGGHEYRVYTTDCGTLVVADSFLSGTFSASDTYASLKEGQTYDVELRGRRVPFFSMFPNVVKAKAVD